MLKIQMAKKRKTRQEKKIADLRRQLGRQKESAQVFPKTAIVPTENKKPIFAPLIPKNNLEVSETKIIKKDLFKTLKLAAVAISLELVIYIISRQA